MLDFTHDNGTMDSFSHSFRYSSTPVRSSSLTSDSTTDFTMMSHGKTTQYIHAERE